mmetsp:Transcript_22306/g.33720  ORF Transcript_22306/g.33720 Transcript_22306/m.33720 type:complete len:119 (-) Transcript_22306:73-429(-)
MLDNITVPRRLRLGWTIVVGETKEFIRAPFLLSIASGITESKWLGALLILVALEVHWAFLFLFFLNNPKQRTTTTTPQQQDSSDSISSVDNHDQPPARHHVITRKQDSDISSVAGQSS